MNSRVAVAGAGCVGFAAATPGLSYKELMFEAARRAYADAGIDARRDVDSFVCCSEDLLEGTSIFDEYVPDQLGAARRPVQTVAADGLFGLATALMLIRSGVARVVAVEAHSKVSDVVNVGAIERYALDPVVNRPLGVSPFAIAGLEMHRFLETSGATEEQSAEVVAKNRANAGRNPRAAYPHEIAAADVADSAPLFWPLTSEMVARPADGCVVLVLADEDRARELTKEPVRVLGVGWSSGSPTLESRDWARADSVERAATMAFEQAGVTRADVDLAEVDDTYAYKELQHLEALGLSGRELPVNVSGGSLGQGNLFEANGLARALECVEQLRGVAGERQVEDARVALAQSWRGVPTTSAAVALFGREGGSG